MAKKNPTQLTLSTQIEVYATVSDLKKTDIELLSKAQKAVETAYAPYSNFQVGAAVLLENGKIIIGNNQENAAYPSSLCAERVAIYQASALYPNIPVKAIAIACKAKGLLVNKPISPCGSCRQAISEYENKFSKKIKIIMSGETGEVYVSDSIENLLPLMFSAKFLPKRK